MYEYNTTCSASSIHCSIAPLVVKNSTGYLYVNVRTSKYPYLLLIKSLYLNRDVAKKKKKRGIVIFKSIGVFGFDIPWRARQVSIIKSVTDLKKKKCCNVCFSLVQRFKCLCRAEPSSWPSLKPTLVWKLQVWPTMSSVPLLPADAPLSCWPFPLVGHTQAVEPRAAAKKQNKKKTWWRKKKEEMTAGEKSEGQYDPLTATSPYIHTVYSHRGSK